MPKPELGGRCFWCLVTPEPFGLSYSGWNHSKNYDAIYLSSQVGINSNKNGQRTNKKYEKMVMIVDANRKGRKEGKEVSGGWRGEEIGSSSGAWQWRISNGENSIHDVHFNKKKRTFSYSIYFEWASKYDRVIWFSLPLTPNASVLPRQAFPPLCPFSRPLPCASSPFFFYCEWSMDSDFETLVRQPSNYKDKIQLMTNHVGSRRSWEFQIKF